MLFGNLRVGAKLGLAFAVMAMLTALGKMEELKLHVRGAINNGLTNDEIKEALLQAAIYAGIPAGLSAFKAAHEVLKAEGRL